MIRRGLPLVSIAWLVGSPLLGAVPEELKQRLERIYDSPAFTAKAFGPARWIRGGDAYTTVEGDAGIVEYETATGKRSILVSRQQLTPAGGGKPLAVDDYQWSKDDSRLLIYTESRRVWRTNSRGDYWVLHRPSQSLKKLGGDAPASSLSFAKFSPDATKVAYVRGNNLYVEDLASGAVRALTSDGSATLVNGASDWVYEEELFLRDGFRWSPDGKSIAFWQFDSSGVEQFTLIDNTAELYPKITKIPYPKAGTKNSAVRVGVIGVEGGTPRWIAVPGDARENYIFRMEWSVQGDALVVGQLNRLQNRMTLLSADAKTGTVKAFFEDKDEAWVDVAQIYNQANHFDWLHEGKSLVWLSERDGWRRVYSVARDGVSQDGGAAVGLTPQGVDVDMLAAVDRRSRWVYYTASPNNATQRYLYRAPVSGGGDAERLSPADQPGTHAYDVAPNGQWAFHTYSRFDSPPLVEVVSLPDHKAVRVLEDNSVLRANSAANPPVEFLEVKVEGSVALDGWLMKPRSFDPTKKYPLVVFVYGEPGALTVTDAWGGKQALFHRALADAGYLVASFDNRGTPTLKGRAWRKSVYGAVGVLSAHDQTKAVLELGRMRPYVDLERVGVWGHSGGGTNTLNLLFRSPEVFRVGVALAPVPDQRLYDTIYQERYMGLPEENADGYRRASPIHHAAGLRGKLLLVHGSGDDNVHMQGTERLANVLIETGKDFDYMIYPNRTHAIAEGKGTLLHRYRLLARYFWENLPAGGR